MKTYVHILQLHTKLKNISYPAYLIEKAVEIPKPLRSDTSYFTETTYSSFWTNLFVQEHDDELGYESNSVHFQIFYFISSIAHSCQEPIEKQIAQKHVLMDQITRNMFLSQRTKDHIQQIFHKTQRTYFALSRFANQIRHRLGKEKIDTDLRMDPINMNSRFSISIVQNGARYHFVLPDLVNIIQTAITNSQDMFPKPLWPKNPYNNLPFTFHQLYNIYFRIKFSYIATPQWIHLFFLSNFDLDIFVIDNEQTLREQYIQCYLKNASLPALCQEIKYMLNSHNSITKRIKIDPLFPRKDLVNIFRPYLYLYLMSQDSVHGTQKKCLSTSILRQMLRAFVKFNPNFGRKVVKTGITYSPIEPRDISNNSLFIFDADLSRRRYITTVSYNSLHIPFTMSDCYKCFRRKQDVGQIASLYNQMHANNQREESSSSDESSETESETFSNVQEAEMEFIANVSAVTYENVESTIFSILNHLGDLADVNFDRVLQADSDA